MATKEERRTTVVNRNYEAARLRICRAGSKRCCEMGRPRGIVRDVDALDHRREYSAPRFCRLFCSYVCIYIYIVYTFGRAPFLPREISNFLHSDDLIKVCYAFVILLSIVSLDIL